MTKGNITGSLSREIQILIAENLLPANLLPVNAVFPELYNRDEQTGRATVNFYISWLKDQAIPGSVRLIIKTPSKEIFNRDVSLYNYISGRFQGRKMMKAEVILSEMNFAQIENNPDTEVTFSCEGQESTFPIYI